MAAAIEQLGDRRARLVLADGKHVWMTAPHVSGDSVVGYEAPHDTGARRAVAVSDITRVETQEFDSRKTVRAVAVAAGGALLVWFGLILLMAGTEYT